MADQNRNDERDRYPTENPSNPYPDKNRDPNTQQDPDRARQTQPGQRNPGADEEELDVDTDSIDERDSNRDRNSVNR